MHVRWLSGNDVEQALPMKVAIDAVRAAYMSAYRGDVVQPIRHRLDVEQGVHLVMPSHEHGLSRSAVKIVSVFPDNTGRGSPAITGVVALFDGETGFPLALLDAASFTAIRTGAASGAATEALANPDASSLAVLGAGAQAPYQALAVCAVRDIEHIRLHNRTRARAEALARWLQERLPDITVTVAASVAEAVADVDIVCTATAAQEPILLGSAVPEGAHVNAVGSFRKDMREFDVELSRRAGRVFVEDETAAFEEAGELADARQAGVLKTDDLVEVGAVFAGDAEGRRSADERTVFKSTGIAAQDLHVATRLFERAKAKDIGVRLPL